jgi:hypothetical protein
MNHFSALPEKRTNLIDRDDDLHSKIEQLFTKFNTVVLNGVSGVGKSTTACEYAHNSLKKSLYKEAKWFESDCVEKLEINYIANMVPAELKHLLTEKNKNLVIEEINKDLSKYSNKSKLLIVFDGVADLSESLFDLVTKDLPDHVHCLITTNQTSFKEAKKLGILEVKPFTRKEAELYLSKVIQRHSPELINELIKLCGQVLLPFKLNQLNMVFGYFKEKAHGELLKELAHIHASKCFIQVMLKDLLAKHPDETDLLKCIAFVDSDCISKLFMGNFNNDTL